MHFQNPWHQLFQALKIVLTSNEIWSFPTITHSMEVKIVLWNNPKSVLMVWNDCAPNPWSVQWFSFQILPLAFYHTLSAYRPELFNHVPDIRFCSRLQWSQVSPSSRPAGHFRAHIGVSRSLVALLLEMDRIFCNIHMMQALQSPFSMVDAGNHW